MTDGASMGSFLRLLAERAAADPAHLGWAVQMYAEAEGQAITDVLTRLGVAESNATDFLACLRPNGERFPEMLSTICVRFGVDERTLLGIMREVEVLDAFRAGGGSGSDREGVDAGLLMAARMRRKRRGHRGVAEDHDAHRDAGRDDEGQDAP